MHAGIMIAGSRRQRNRGRAGWVFEKQLFAMACAVLLWATTSQETGTCQTMYSPQQVFADTRWRNPLANSPVLERTTLCGLNEGRWKLDAPPQLRLRGGKSQKNEIQRGDWKCDACGHSNFRRYSPSLSLSPVLPHLHFAVARFVACLLSFTFRLRSSLDVSLTPFSRSPTRPGGLSATVAELLSLLTEAVEEQAEDGAAAAAEEGARHPLLCALPPSVHRWESRSREEGR